MNRIRLSVVSLSTVRWLGMVRRSTARQISEKEQNSSVHRNSSTGPYRQACKCKVVTDRRNFMENVQQLSVCHFPFLIGGKVAGKATASPHPSSQPPQTCAPLTSPPILSPFSMPSSQYYHLTPMQIYSVPTGFIVDGSAHKTSE